MATYDTTSPLKRLITAQGVLTLLGLVTGMAAIFLPFGFINAKPLFYIDVSVPLMLASVAAALADPKFFVLLVLPVLLLLLAVPISAGYLRWLITGGLAPWVWRTVYALAVLGGAVVVSWIGWGLSEAVVRLLITHGALDDKDVQLGVTVFCALGSLALGAWLVMRNRRVGLPHALNALIAMQVVYVTNALMLLVVYLVIEEAGEIGAWFALLTVVVYVVQIVLGSLRKGGTETLGGGTPQH